MDKKIEKNETSGVISEVLSKLKKNEPKEGVDLVSITKKLSAKKFGKKS